jgi:hypothetical protein
VTRRHDAPGEAAERQGQGPDLTLVCAAHALSSYRGAAVLIASRGGPHTGSGDARPPHIRPGARDAAALPSRMGNTLRWPDGRVTRHPMSGE